MNVSKAATSGQSLNERQFILQALEKDNVRIDGRRPHDLRPIRLHFGRSHGTSHAEVQLGRTRIRTVVTSEIVRPYPDRPVEGFLSFNLDPTRLQESSGGRQDSEARAVALTTIVENGIREARAIDTEALCIVAGDKAWSIHCASVALVVCRRLMALTASQFHLRSFIACWSRITAINMVVRALDYS